MLIKAERISAINVKLLGSTFLSAVKEYYSEPRNEEAFQAWMQKQNLQGGQTDERT